MKKGILLLCELLLCVVSFGMYGVEAPIRPTEETPQPWVSRTIPGGKSLQDIFDWFAKVDQEDASGLKFQVMRSKDDSIRMDVEVDEEVEEDWACLSPTNPVAVLSGERKRFWVPGVVITVAVDDELFQVNGCTWLSNAAHKVYVSRSKGSEFSKTVEVDRYVVSPDLHKAYYLEGKTDVDYPFPFVNSTPDLTKVELEDFLYAKRLVAHVDETVKAVEKRLVSPEPGMRYKVSLAVDGSARYVMFERKNRLVTYAEYSAKGESDAFMTLNMHNFDEGTYNVVWLSSDGALSDLESVKLGKLRRERDESFKRAFAREVLTRLKLTAADLPGINLDAILGEPEAKK